MTKTLTSIIIGLLVVSCNNENRTVDIEGEHTIEFSTKELYLRSMVQNNFLFETNGPCDDALEDTIHERSVVYFDSKTINDSNAVVEFKFIEACCQDFLGDYIIKNDTLIFTYEQVNEQVCSCLCWYKYKLTINEPREKYANIKIVEK